MAVLDVPLLFETGGNARVDYVIVVSAPASVQLARVRARRRMSEAEIARMIRLQMPDAIKRGMADRVVRTGLSRFHASRAVREFLREGSRPFLKKGPNDFCSLERLGRLGNIIHAFDFV